MSINKFMNPGKFLPAFFILTFNCVGFAREAAFAGKFYPADKEELSKFVDSALAGAVPTRLTGRVRAIIAPHAGYDFSGVMAAYAYNVIDTQYDLVVILGVGHTMAVKGAALLAEGYYETPLGKVPVDEKFAAELIKASPLFENRTEAHLNEHSIEVQLPFLQRRLKKPFKILPAVLNNAGPDELAEIGRMLGRKLKGKKALIVVSTDFSHYPRHEDALAADKTLSLAIAAMDPGYFWLTNRILLAKDVPGLETCACGEAAVGAAMAAVNELGPSRFVELKYADSYDRAPDLTGPEKVVGYIAGAFVGALKVVPGQITLSPGQKKELLSEARTEIENRLLGRKSKNDLLSKDYAFNLPAAVFVTLTENGALRGCVGTIEPRMGLLDAVRYGANAAAFADTRFRPLEKPELEKIKAEISVLSPLKKAPNAKEIVQGKHGVVVVKDGHSGLFLPQVWEQIPGKKDFLSELCFQKAGLERDCWQDKNASIYVFTVDSFRE
ncbi:MAG: hypothetical protein A2270_11295 [Elusimicrobia bacterium RIFOXYA12_FULL_51_18]|nr:MAG: hypothetical protein A2270_11295 [Elusimicrobia bacterium RIFOXYA12_FULL_51_18]OGS30325.1 MAG: hypothetical protein A2218_01525 [Elusimicrobia bacterium RIFOXYA2_FULL_53_38]